MSGYKNLRLERRDARATVTLDRQDVHNAFDETLICELTECFRRLSEDPGTRVIVLAGAGSSFCAGADLNWMRRMAAFSREENIADARTFHAMMAAVAECPKVTIARVHGAALGGGAGLVAACDLAIASVSARFGFTEARLGLAPAVIAPYVVRRIGEGAFRALAVTGDRFGPDVALRLGLVHEIVAPAELDAAINFAVGNAMFCGPVAIRSLKSLLRDIEGRTPAEASDATAACIADLRAGAEAQEGIRAFLEKRRAGFVG